MSRHGSDAAEADGFGARLRQARLDRGWTQPQLGDHMRVASGGAINLSPSEISRYERGKVTNPAFDVIAAAAKATGLPVDHFAPTTARGPNLLVEISRKVDELARNQRLMLAELGHDGHAADEQFRARLEGRLAELSGQVTAGLENLTAAIRSLEKRIGSPSGQQPPAASPKRAQRRR